MDMSKYSTEFLLNHVSALSKELNLINKLIREAPFHNEKRSLINRKEDTLSEFDYAIKVLREKHARNLR
jgi:hypothetical protein